MKKLVIGIIIVVVLAVAWYLVSPLFITVEVEEESPIKDALDAMSAAEKAEFDAAVEAMSNVTMVMADVIPEGPSVSAQGDFVDRAHGVMGKALLIETAEGKILRFEDFETVNGPNLHIYLASSLGDDDFVDLGKIRATKGSVNYEIPAGTDTDRYNKVLIWCVPFKVLFGYSELK